MFRGRVAARVVHAQLRVRALLVAAAPNVAEPGALQCTRERLEVVAELVMLEQRVGGRACASLREEALEVREIVGQAALAAALSEERVVALDVRAQIFLDVGDDDTDDAARREHAPNLD